MKKIYGFLTLSLAMLVLACEEKENLDPVGNWEITAPVPGTPVDNTSLILDEDTPTAPTTFEWQPATTSNRFVIGYTFKLTPEGETEPIVSFVTGNAGKDRSVTMTAEEIDYALWAACFPAGETVNLNWIVEAKSIEKIATSSRKIVVKRFETERIPTTLFITGEGTEAGADVGNATAMRARKDANGNETGVFDVYITLTEGKTYQFRDLPNAQSKAFGGSEGTLSCGTEITAPTTGQYRVTADVVNNTYDVLKIERWSLVGDAVEGGWGGDVPLDYVGNGVWKKDIEFLQEAGFLVRANGDWGYLLKRIKNTGSADNKSGKLFMESEAGDAGIEYEDIPGTTGMHTVTVDLSTDPYSYSLVPKIVEPTPVDFIIGKSSNSSGDAVSGNFIIGEYDTPDELYLLANGEVIVTFEKDGDVFHSVEFFALEKSKTYTLNSAADGSGTTYIEEGDGLIAVDHDQAYQINVDFANDKLSWKHYNMKLFHWNNDGGWDQRQEIPMTYIHPYKYEATGTLSAGFDSKFNSPWEVQFGTTATTLTGTMINNGENFKGITSSGAYKATITVSPDYSTAEYAFVKQ